jgi:hypothetical protein
VNLVLVYASTNYEDRYESILKQDKVGDKTSFFKIILHSDILDSRRVNFYYQNSAEDRE